MVWRYALKRIQPLAYLCQYSLPEPPPVRMVLKRNLDFIMFQRRQLLKAGGDLLHSLQIEEGSLHMTTVEHKNLPVYYLPPHPTGRKCHLIMVVTSLTDLNAEASCFMLQSGRCTTSPLSTLKPDTPQQALKLVDLRTEMLQQMFDAHDIHHPKRLSPCLTPISGSLAEISSPYSWPEGSIGGVEDSCLLHHLPSVNQQMNHKLIDGTCRRP